MAFKRQVKNFMKNYSDAEVKVREATSNDPWGPSSSLMLDISDLTFNTISLSEIMNMLWQRLSHHGKNWRHVYKSLMLMDYLIKNGSKKVIQLCREGFCNLQTLKDFQHVDEAGKDQGYYVREKSKQVITLLMDEQLLCKEREVACRTRLRTSSSMAFPKRLPAAGNTPTVCASAPTPEIPASKNKYKLLKFSSLRDKKNASKAGLKHEQCQDTQLPGGAVSSQETLPLKSNAWKSTEDLILFSEDEPKLLLPTAPPVPPSATQLLEGQPDVCHLWDPDTVPTPAEKSLSLQTSVSLDKKSDSTLTDTVTENPLQTPLEKQAAAKCSETLLSEEECVHLDLRTSSSGFSFYDRSSVETLYVSPSFKLVDPVKEAGISKDDQKPAHSTSVQMDDESLQAITVQVSTASKETSSSSTLSVPPPNSAAPEKSVHLTTPILTRPSFWTHSHQPFSSASFKDKDKTHLPCVPGVPASSDEEERDSLNLPNSHSPKKKASPISGSNWVEFFTRNIGHFTSESCSSSMSDFSLQTTKGSCEVSEANRSTNILLGEVKNAIIKLHEDLSMVIRELNVINSHLVSMSGSSPQVGRSLRSPPPSEGNSEEV